MKYQGKDAQVEIGGPTVYRGDVVDSGDQTLELVVRGIPERIHGMSVTNVEERGTGLENAVSCPEAMNKEITRHGELREAEAVTKTDIKLPIQVLRRGLSIQWETGAGRNSTDGAHRNQAAGEWQIPCCQ